MHTISFTPQLFASEEDELKTKEQLFLALDSGQYGVRLAVHTVATYFRERGMTQSDIDMHWTTYWQWLGQWLWGNMVSCDKQDIVEFLIPTLPIAMRNFVNLEAQYVEMLAYKKSQESMFVHAEITKRFVESVALLHPSTQYVDQSVRVGDVATFLTQQTKQGAVEDYSVLAHLDEVLYTGMFLSETEAFVVQKTMQIQRLLSFGKMLLKNVSAGEIVSMYDELFAEDVLAQEGEFDELTKGLVAVRVLEQVVETSEYKTAVKENVDVDQSNIEEKVGSQNPLSIQFQSAQSTFGTDLSTIDIPVLLSYLDTQATEQGDERIRDLVRFNESTGKFEWNTDMLSE